MTRILETSLELRIVSQDTGRLSSSKTAEKSRSERSVSVTLARDVARRAQHGAAPLRRLRALACFTRVRRNWIEAGVTTGLIAAAATSGALMGFGLRFGTPLRPFNTIAASVLGVAAVAASNAPGMVTTIGIAIHVAACIAWSLAYAWIVEFSHGHEWEWGVATSLVAFALTSMLARSFDVGLGTLLSVAQRIALAVVLAIALPMGMRLANSDLRRSARSP